MEQTFVAAVTIQVWSRPAGSFAVVAISGDIDMAADVTLADATERLRAYAPSDIVVDLAGVTFACSTLAKFLDGVRKALPAVTLVLCRPTPLTRRVLELTGTNMNTITDVCDDLPPGCPTTDTEDRGSAHALAD